MVSTDLSNGAGFRSVRSEDIDWKPFPAFPPSARLAILVGDPTEPGLYTIRVKLPSGLKLMPHWHPEDRIYTVVSGVFYIGLGHISTARSWRPIRRVPSSCSPAEPLTSTGRGPASTSPRYRPSARLASNTGTPKMTHGHARDDHHRDRDRSAQDPVQARSRTRGLRLGCRRVAGGGFAARQGDDRSWM